MIELTDQDVAEFQLLYQRQTGQEISLAQARRYAQSLVDLVAWVALPDRSSSSRHDDLS